MLYLLYGEDTFRSRKNLSSILDSYKAKSGDFGLFYFEKDNFDKEQFEELLKSRSLFDSKYVVVCEWLFEEGELLDFISEKIEKIALSDNIFFFLEEKVEACALAKIEKVAKKIQKFSTPTPAVFKKAIMTEAENLGIEKGGFSVEEIEKKCGANMWCASKELEKIFLGGKINKKDELSYSPFAIADAIGAKDKRRAWLVLQKAIISGVPLPELYWKAMWEIKNLLIAKHLLNTGAKDIAKETGWHPYVAQKTIASAQNYTLPELEDLSFRFTRAFQEWRSNEKEIEIVLEKAILG
jgi:DNA polymerase III delta subunit